MTRKNDIIELLITDLDETGNGVGRVDGFPFFVRHAVPGDTVRAVVTKVLKKFGYAKTLQVLSPSIDRKKAECPANTRCGGCQLQLLRYDAQLRFKENKVRSCLERIGGFQDIPIEKIAGSDLRYRYRNKAQIPVAAGESGDIIAGFYAERSHTIIPAEDCLLVPESFASIVTIVKTWMRRFHIAPYNERTGEGCVRHIIIRKSSATGSHAVCLVVNDSNPGLLNGKKPVPAGEGATGSPYPRSEYGTRAHSLPGRGGNLWSALAEMLTAKHDIAGISCNIHSERNNVILGSVTETVFGSGRLTDQIGSVRFEISPASFYQINPTQTEKLYEYVASFCALSGEEKVVDVYCGTGTISLYLASSAFLVYGIEVVKDAVADARRNARLNGFENARFICGRAEEKLPGLVREEGGIDVIVLDPPRKGCDPSVLDAVLEAAPEKIVYVSCNPATLARDLKYLLNAGTQDANIAKALEAAGDGTDPHVADAEAGYRMTAVDVSPGNACGGTGNRGTIAIASSGNTGDGTGIHDTDGGSESGVSGTGAVPRYVIERIQPVDMFPQTAHVETVVLMSRVRD